MEVSRFVCYKSDEHLATREMGFRVYPGVISDGPSTYANLHGLNILNLIAVGIIAGQFIQPIMQDMYIMPFHRVSSLI